MFIVQISQLVQRTGTIYPLVLELTLLRSHLTRRMQRFAAANAIHTVSVFVPPGTHYCWVVRGNVDSNLAQGFLYMTDVPGIELSSALYRYGTAMSFLFNFEHRIPIGHIFVTFDATFHFDDFRLFWNFEISV